MVGTLTESLKTEMKALWDALPSIVVVGGQHRDGSPTVMAVGVIDGTCEAIFRALMCLGPSRSESHQGIYKHPLESSAMAKVIPYHQVYCIVASMAAISAKRACCSKLEEKKTVKNTQSLAMAVLQYLKLLCNDHSELFRYFSPSGLLNCRQNSCNK